jgi:hypothetical protein
VSHMSRMMPLLSSCRTAPWGCRGRRTCLSRRLRGWPRPTRSP